MKNNNIEEESLSTPKKDQIEKSKRRSKGKRDQILRNKRVSHGKKVTIGPVEVRKEILAAARKSRARAGEVKKDSEQSIPHFPGPIKYSKYAKTISRRKNNKKDNQNDEITDDTTSANRSTVLAIDVDEDPRKTFATKSLGTSLFQMNRRSTAPTILTLLEQQDMDDHDIEDSAREMTLNKNDSDISRKKRIYKRTSRRSSRSNRTADEPKDLNI